MPLFFLADPLLEFLFFYKSCFGIPVNWAFGQILAAVILAILPNRTLHLQLLVTGFLCVNSAQPLSQDLPVLPLLLPVEYLHAFKALGCFASFEMGSSCGIQAGSLVYSPPGTTGVHHSA